MRKKISPYNLIIASSGIVLVLLVSVLFGYSFANKGLIVASSRQVNTSYYLVEVGKFEEYAEAQTKSGEVMEKGGAGFIFFADGFRVFISGYLTESDAKKVAIKNDGASVYELKLNSYEFSSKLSQNANQVFKNNILSFKNCIESLNKNISSYQLNEINETTFKANCLLLVEEIDMQIEKFDGIFYESTTMYHYKNYINNFRDTFSKMVSLDSTGIDFIRTINYQQISAMITLRNILQIL